MGNKTITVRFDPELYNKIKSHELSSSDIIRQGVRMFFYKEKKQKNNWSNKNFQEFKPNASTHLLTNNSSNNSFELRNQSGNLYNSIDETLELMDKLKNEINQLDQELETWIDEYSEIENNQDNYKDSKWSSSYQF